jgi:hypothetical protein
MPRQAAAFADGQILIYCNDADNHFGCGGVAPLSKALPYGRATAPLAKIVAEFQTATGAAIFACDS